MVWPLLGPNCIVISRGRAINQHEFTKSRDGKRILRLLVGQLGNGVESLYSLFLGDAVLFWQSSRQFAIWTLL